jgi:hypothetical protein
MRDLLGIYKLESPLIFKVRNYRPIFKLTLTGTEKSRHNQVSMVENITLKYVRSTLLKAKAHGLQEVDDTVLNNGP